MLASLEEETTQHNIVRRLEDKLYVKWHEFRRERFGRKLNIPFERFSNWIMEQAEIYLDCQNSIPKTSQSTSKAPTFHSPASPNQPRRANPPSSSRNPSRSNTSQNQWLNSSGRYPTGVGKPMHESSRASSPVKSSQSQDQAARLLRMLP